MNRVRGPSLIEELEEELESARADFAALRKVHAHTCQQLGDARADVEDLKDELRAACNDEGE